MQKVTLKKVKNKKLKILFLGHYVISDLNGKEIVGMFFEKELKKTNQTVFSVEKRINRKGDKLYIKWKGHDNSFNSWFDKKDHWSLNHLFR